MEWFSVELTSTLSFVKIRSGHTLFVLTSPGMTHALSSFLHTTTGVCIYGNGFSLKGDIGRRGGEVANQC